jgi:hypothetical protein
MVGQRGRRGNPGRRLASGGVKRTEELAGQLEIGAAQPDGWRYLTFHGLEVGRFRFDPATRLWTSEWRGGWQPTPVDYDGKQPVEAAEVWATYKVAEMLTGEKD